MTTTEPDQAAADAARDFAQRLVAHWQAALGSRLLGVYLIGSLAHGGFSHRYSDVDMAVITTDGLSADVIERVRRGALALSADWGGKLSVFWADRAFSIGRFPPLHSGIGRSEAANSPRQTHSTRKIARPICARCFIRRDSAARISRAK